MRPLAPHVGRLLALGADRRHPAGAVLGLRTRAGRSIEAGGWALLPSERSPGVRMTPDTWLDWASVTKVAATTTLCMVLQDRGLLDVDAPVADHLPSFAAAGDEDGRDDIRVADLLSHSAGLPPWVPLYCTAADRDAALEAVLRTPLALAPRTERRYSDLGFVVAGLVVEEVTGQRLDAAFDDLVAAPLGLSTRFGPVPPDWAAASADSDVVELTMVATGRPYPVDVERGCFSGWRQEPVRGGVNDGNAAHALGGVAGHAGLLGPVRDLLTLGAALLDDGLVGPSVLTRFASPTAVDGTQGLGFRRVLRADAGGHPVTWLWHGGFTGTVWALDPESGTVVAGGATRLHGTTGPLPRWWPVPGAPDPLAGVASGDQVAAAALDAVSTAVLEEAAR